MIKKNLFKSSIRYLASSVMVFFMAMVMVNCGGSDDDVQDGIDDNGGSSSSSVVEIIPNSGMDLYGYIGNTDNQPVSDVVVTDGFTCVKTNSNGIYQMKQNANADFVYYSIPSEYKVNTHSEEINTAYFYKPLSSEKRYDFTLTKLDNGIEKNFKVITIGDPQVSNRTTDKYYSAKGVSSTSGTYSNMWRFKNETMEDIENTLSEINIPVYGLVMGDVCEKDCGALQVPMRTALGATSMTVFSVIGNHDKQVSANVLSTSSYTNAWGPLNYSFNRGNIHFVAMDNIIFSSYDSYTGGFTADQVEWLRQDLSYVSKSMMVILYYHIPLRSTNYAYRSTVLGMLSDFAGYSLFCGHTHYNEIYSQTDPITTLEHIHAAACGAWWKSTLNNDGTPNGYEVYSINGTDFTDWYYKSVSRDKSFQMRLSEADHLYGGTHGYFDYADQLSLTKNEGYVVANIFNADKNWTVKAYEGTSMTGVSMTKVSKEPDSYAVGYHVGVLGRNLTSYDGGSDHTYSYKRTDPGAVVEVVATDEFGNEYHANTFVDGFTEAMYYPCN